MAVIWGTPTGHDAGGADGAGPDADLDGVGSGLDEVLGGGGGGDVAGHELEVGVGLLDVGDHVEHAARVAVGGVHDDDVHLGLDQGGHAVEGAGADANGGSGQQAAVGVLGRVGVLDGLLDVLDGYQADEDALGVHQGQLLDLVLFEQRLGLGHGDAELGRYKPVFGHGLLDGAGGVHLEADVAVGDDADELAVVVGDGDSGDVVVVHELHGVCHGVLGREEEGVGDDAMLGALDLEDLSGLVFDGHVLVDDADAALSGHGDGHLGLRDGVHARAHDGDVQADAACQAGADVGLPGQHLRPGGQEQHVVESQAIKTQNLFHGW